MAETPMAETGQHDQRYERNDGGSPEAERLVFERLARELMEVQVRNRRAGGGGLARAFHGARGRNGHPREGHRVGHVENVQELSRELKPQRERAFEIDQLRHAHIDAPATQPRTPPPRVSTSPAPGIHPANPTSDSMCPTCHSGIEVFGMMDGRVDLVVGHWLEDVGASDAGAESIGLNIVLPHEQAPNPYVTPYLSFQFHYFALRKMHFLIRAKAVAVFPGGFGTFDEMFETLTLIQTGKMKPIPLLLFGKEFWTRAIDFGALAREGVISPRDLELISWCETAEDAWNCIAEFYKLDRADR